MFSKIKKIFQSKRRTKEENSNEEQNLSPTTQNEAQNTIIELSKKQKKFLINLAWDTIRTFIYNPSKSLTRYISEIEDELNMKMKKVDPNFYDKLNTKFGVFTTLKLKNKPERENLRGCIGIVKPIYPLYQAIIRTAYSAAFEDERFYKLTKEELDDVVIEISILSKPELINAHTLEEYEKQINLGEDGLIIETHFGSGLLLPQVFDEWNVVHVKDALEMVSKKAGLPGTGWKHGKIYKFKAVIVDEVMLK